jgi:hypothetical protein
MLPDDQKKEGLHSVEGTWESIKGGTFVADYVRDMRTALQKAIDKNETNIRVERKRVVEDGDLRMFDGKEWVQFCIHKAKKLINEDRMFVTTQERMGGIWVNHSDKHQGIFNNSLDENPTKGKLKDVYWEHLSTNGLGISYEKPENHILYGYESKAEWHRKAEEQERQAYRDEGRYEEAGDRPRRRRL